VAGGFFQTFIDRGSPFKDGRLHLGVNLLIPSGYSGQSIENFGASELAEVFGVRLPSYARVTFRGNGSP
jgi:hypothetical protein